MNGVGKNKRKVLYTQNRVLRDGGLGMETMNVIVIGGLHHNTLGCIRALGEDSDKKCNIHVLVIGKHLNRKNILSTSKYVTADTIHYLDSDEDIIPWLIEFHRDGKRWTIICCSDGSAEVVLNHNKELHKQYNVPTIGIKDVDYMSKEIQTNIAVDCGLQVPISKSMATQDHISWSIFPCIIKPLKSVAGKGKADIHIVRSLEELQNALSNTGAESVQLQQYIEKKMEYQLIGCSLRGGEQIIIPGYTSIIRQPENTNTGYLQYLPIDELHFDRAAVERFISKIGYSGLFSVEFIRDKDDNDYFLEINLRNDGNAYCVKTAGVNLPFIWVYFNEYDRVPDCRMTFDEPVYFIPDFIDMKLGIMSVGTTKWLSQFVHAKSHTLLNKNDMGPFLYEFGYRCRRFVKKRF